MTKYREILRLKSLGFSERNIAHSCGVSRNTVAKVVKRAAEIKLSWPLEHDMTDSALEEMLFPKVKSATNRRMPDYDYIRRELLRNGVNKKLLWVEYCEECRMNSEEPLMYSQFCYYIQKDEEKQALLYSRTPSYKSIKNLLAAMKEDSDPVSQNPDSISSETQSQARGITRGARYYGGKRS